MIIEQVKLRPTLLESGVSQIGLTRVTVLVGANDCGKTTFLKELKVAASRDTPKELLWIDSVEVDRPGYEEFRRYFERVTGSDLPSEADLDDSSATIRVSQYFNNMGDAKFIGTDGGRKLEPSGGTRLWADLTLWHNTASQRRLRSESINLRNLGRRNYAERFHGDGDFRSDIRHAVHQAFGKHIVLDPLDTHQCEFKLSDRDPEKAGFDQWSSDEDTQRYLRGATQLVQMSHGVQNYTYLLVNAYEPRYLALLIDEPEISLSPPLARLLGAKMAEACKANDKQLIAATHSADFVLGCIQGGADVTIIRLDRTGLKPSCRTLFPATVKKMMHDPLLRSTSVVDALFHKFAIVTEADADRAFYEEINHRLCQSGEVGVPDAVFVRAQNWQTIPRIVEMLRGIGIPAAGIVDLDVIKSGGKVWSRFMDAFGVSGAAKESMCAARTSVVEMYRKYDEEYGEKDYLKRHGGVDACTSSDSKSLKHLVENLRKYGLFIVPCGEFEQWLPRLDVSRSKHKWLYEIFSRMGDDPDEEGYLNPSPAEDVWRFVNEVGQWCVDSERKGMPEELTTV